MARDWSTYWCSADEPLEAMHAHFERHVYHRHSHDTYSFGVTEDGAQAFTCRGSGHTSAAGMVMAFNPDDPHDGRPCDDLGFTYRMVHIGPELVTAILAGLTGRRAGRPLFADPVISDPVLAAQLRALHRALLSGEPPLRRDELLTATIHSIVRRAAVRAELPARTRLPIGAAAIARRAREAIHDGYLGDITTSDLAAATGRSRLTIHRAFTAMYGIAPSDYQRQLRLRAARRLIAPGMPLSEAALQAGFADQSHLTRWFSRYSVSRQAAISAPCSDPGCSRWSPVGRCRRWPVTSIRRCVRIAPKLAARITGRGSVDHACPRRPGRPRGGLR